MNKSTLKKNFITVSLLGVFVYTGSATAHDINGALGKAAGATDYYQVECFDDGAGAADHLVVEIKDLAPVASPLISVQVTKGIIAKNSTDAVDGNATYSPTLTVNGGNGSYYLIVDKTAAKAETYNLQIHCETSAGLHTGTSEPALLQNQ
ncbi:MAG: hypothetical protein EPN17_06635 [Methylobacter sp.]|nr:MAG: hypothetical protein EPN17_06635 [Methylobacter sp.]